MNEQLAGLAALDASGLISAADLYAVGWHPSRVQRSRRSRELVRVRRGFYVTGDQWDAATIDERHRMRVRAEVLSAAAPLVLSHHSAAVMHGLPSIGPWPERVHMTATDATGGRSGGARAVHRTGPPPATVEIGGVTVTSLARTLADIAIASPAQVSVPMLDAALRRQTRRDASGRYDARNRVEALRNEVLETVDAIAPVRGRRSAEFAIAFADPLAANAGESLSRVRIAELGFEVPELQVRFDEVYGSYAEVDFFWRGIRRVGEFDGDQKYTRSRALSGMEPASVVLAEKRREDALRRKGLMVTRWDWALLWRPAEFAALLLEAGVPRARARVRVVRAGARSSADRCE